MKVNIIKKEHSKMFEVLVLILISVSPLIPNSLKAAVVFVIVIFNIKYVKKVNKNKTTLLILMAMIFLIGLINDFGNINTISELNILSLYFPLCILLGFILSTKYNRTQYLVSIEKIIFVFAVLSLFGVLIYTLAPSLVYRFPTYNYYHTTRHTGFIFNFVISDEGHVVARNSGIAWEPGVFQFLVNIGVHAYLQTTIKVEKFKILTYALVILTTGSTAGMLIFAITTFRVIFFDKRIRWVFLLMIALFSGQIKDELIYQYNYKLFGSYAFDSRLEPMKNAFRVAIESPLGLGNVGYNQNLRQLNIGAWDSYGQIVVRYGYGMLTLILVSLYNILKEDKVLFFILVITFSSQGIWFTPLITPFYFMTTNVK